MMTESFGSHHDQHQPYIYEDPFLSEYSLPITTLGRELSGLEPVTDVPPLLHRSMSNSELNSAICAALSTSFPQSSFLSKSSVPAAAAEETKMAPSNASAAQSKSILNTPTITPQPTRTMLRARRGVARYQPATPEVETSSVDDSGSFDSETPSTKSNNRKKPTSKRERNKVSASQYRKRRKMYLDSLEQKVVDLTDTLTQQSDRISNLDTENKLLKEQLNFLKNLLSFKTKQDTSIETPTTAAISAAVTVSSSPVPPCSPSSSSISSHSSASSPMYADITTRPHMPVQRAYAPIDDGLHDAHAHSGDVFLTKLESDGPKHNSMFLFILFSCFLLFAPFTYMQSGSDNGPHRSRVLLGLEDYFQAFSGNNVNINQNQPSNSFFTSSTPSKQLFPMFQPHSSSMTFPYSESSLTVRSSSQVLVNRTNDPDFQQFVHTNAYQPLVNVVGAVAAQEALRTLATGVFFVQNNLNQTISHRIGTTSH